MKWQYYYLIATFDPSDRNQREKFRAQVDAIGLDGWELVSYNLIPGSQTGHELIFKRPIAERKRKELS